MREQFQYDLKRDERFGSPVDGNEGKESMLNLVPLAGGRWLMSHRDREAFLVGKFLEFLLPKTISCPIRATPIRRDQQFVVIAIERFAKVSPPSSDTLHCKLSRIMIDAHVHKAMLVDQIIDAIGHRFALSQRKKVIHVDAGLLSFCLPFTPIVLKIANEFLLLAIH